MASSTLAAAALPARRTLVGQSGRVIARHARHTGRLLSIAAANSATLNAAPRQSSASAALHSSSRSSLATTVEEPSPSNPSIANGLGIRGLKRKIWRRSEIQKIYDGPLMELVFKAAQVHRQHHDPSKVQLCTLLNIKTGGCSEDCSYCSQSSKNPTGLKATKLMDIEPVLKEARRAKENGSTRFCMGAAWRDLNGRKTNFKRILEMVKEINGMGLEVCTTLGMLNAEQAVQLKEAGLTAYNHNLDTSREYYPKVITTRSYDERLETIKNVRDAGISVCSGGIIGLGESAEDRVGLIWEMSQLPSPPESFPVNALVPIEGTPLSKNEFTTIHTMLRTIATARIVLPTSIIRLAAGRISYSESEQAMCFMAGANAIFTGERMLTTPTSGWDEDNALLGRWGMQGMRSSSEHLRMQHNNMDEDLDNSAFESEEAMTSSAQIADAERKADQVAMQSEPRVVEKMTQPGVWS